MKKLFVPLLLILLSLTANAYEFKKGEDKALVAQIKGFDTAYERRNTDLIMKATPDEVMNFYGGAKQYKPIVEGEINKRNKGLSVNKSIVIGKPGKVIEADGYLFTFVPRERIFERSGDRMKEVSFVFALKQIKDKDWKFMYGASLREHPTGIFELFPKLPKDTPMPPNTLDKISSSGTKTEKH